jgi:hypothetical protein
VPNGDRHCEEDRQVKPSDQQDGWDRNGEQGEDVREFPETSLSRLV